MAQKSYQYSETEERAFKFLETTGENAELLSLRRLTNEALTSGKAVRYAAPPMFKRKKKTKSFRGRKRVRVAHPAHPIYKGTRRWKGVMG